MNFKSSSTHGKRIVTASLIIPILFSILYWGGPIFFLGLIWVCFLVGNREFFHLAYQKPPRSILWLHWLLGTAALGLAFLKGIEGLFLALILGQVICFFLLARSFPYQKPFYDSLGKQLFALWYLPLYLGFFVLIRLEPRGIDWLFFLLVVNYAGDTAAFYVGRTWGRHKLAPMVSPQKTVEGSLGGLAANLLVALIFDWTLFPDYPWMSLAGLGLVIGVVSQLGDLLESMFKRTARIKDSGSLFPGHGGFLDRVDSLLLPGPLLYFFIKWVIP